MLVAVLDGNEIDSIEDFYYEIQKKLTKNLDWEIGHNLNAFVDILRGGFGLHEYDEEMKIIWNNSSHSKITLGWEETIRYLNKSLEKCHPSNRENILKEIEDAKERKGKTLFEIIVEIIKDNKHIELVIK